MRQRKHDRIMTGRAANRLLWFTVGQALQLVLHALFFNFWESQQLSLCAAAFQKKQESSPQPHAD